MGNRDKWYDILSSHPTNISRVTKRVISIVTGIDVTGPSGGQGYLIAASESKLETMEVFGIKFLDLNTNIRQYRSCRLVTTRKISNKENQKKKHQAIIGGNKEENVSGSQSVIQLSTASASRVNWL